MRMIVGINLRCLINEWSIALLCKGMHIWSGLEHLFRGYCVSCHFVYKFDPWTGSRIIAARSQLSSSRSLLSRHETSYHRILLPSHHSFSAHDIITSSNNNLIMIMIIMNNDNNIHHHHHHHHHHHPPQNTLSFQMPYIHPIQTTLFLPKELWASRFWDHRERSRCRSLQATTLFSWAAVCGRRLRSCSNAMIAFVVFSKVLS